MQTEQINYAQRQLAKMHPLYNLELELCLPFLDPVIGVTRRCFFKSRTTATHEEQKSLAGADALKNRDLELAIDKQGTFDGGFDFHLDEGEDAIGRLGYGVVSYFKLIKAFFWVFLLVTLAHVPTMMDFA